MRHIAKGVRKWNLLEEKGYAFFITESRRDQVWFHVTELPQEIRHWFPRDGQSQSYMPRVSFEVITVQKNNQSQEQAADIRLAPISSREVFWRNGDQLISVEQAIRLQILNCDKLDLEESDFWFCNRLPVLPRDLKQNPCEDWVIPTERFVIGQDQVEHEIHPIIQKRIEADFVKDFSTELVRENGDRSGLNFGDRLEELRHSFGFTLSAISRKLMADKIKSFDSDIPTNTIKNLEHYLPEIVEFLWIKKSRQLPMVAIDLESDGERIWEFALVGQEGIIADLKNPTDEQIEKELAKISPETILLGHNLENWDLKILRKKGFNIDHIKTGDTLQTEMRLDPLRPCYALDTKHRAVDDAQVTLELVKNQFLRRNNQSNHVAQNARKQADTFFLKPGTPTWYTQITSLLSKSGKILIVGPAEYAPTLMQPPQLQVIQPTAKSISFDEDKGRFWQWYSEEVERMGYRAIAELAPGVFQDKWTLSEEKIVPDIPAGVSKVYCSFSDYIRAEIREKIQVWKPVQMNLLFSEVIPFNSRQYLRTLDEREYREKIEERGLWIHFALGRSYASLQSLGLSIEEFMPMPEKRQGLTRFWLEKTIRGGIELWGCVTANDIKNYPRNYRFLEHSIDSKFDNYPAKFIVPIMPSKWAQIEGEIMGDRRLTPETIYRRDYWNALLPFILLYSRDAKWVILAINEWEEIAPLQTMLKAEFDSKKPIKLDIITCEEKDNLRSKIRRLSKSIAGILILPMSQVDRSIREWQLESLEAGKKGNLTLILESVPVRLTPALGVVRQDSPSVDTEDFMEDRRDEENPDGEENETDEEEVESREIEPDIKKSKKCKLLRLGDLVAASIPVLEKIALLLSKQSDVRLVCLDSRLPEINLKKGHILKRHYLKELPETDSQNQSATDFHQPGHQNWSLPDRKTWEKAIEAAFIPGFSLSDEQKEHLEVIMPRQITHRFVSLPTGGGKSIVFQAPALYRGYQTRRLTVVISPLKSLIKYQERSLLGKGFIETVDGLTGDMSPTEIEDCYRRIRVGETLLIYTAPERFRSKRFRKVLAERFNRDGGPEYWVFDEAHCLSLWGLDFRPDYFYAAEFVKTQIEAGRRAPILLMSATMTAQVKNDLCKILNLKNDDWEVQ